MHELLTLREHLSSSPVFCGVRVAHLFSFCVLYYYVSLRSEFRVVISVLISHKYDVRFVLYLQLFVGGRMSYLRYLCLFPHTGGQHILRCVFVVFFFILLSVSLNCPL